MSVLMEGRGGTEIRKEFLGELHKGGHVGWNLLCFLFKLLIV